MISEPDIYVLCGLLTEHGDWTYRSLATRLHVPHAVVQRALVRSRSAGLYSPERRQVHLPNFEEFAVHALRFVAPAELGALAPGVPAAWAAEPMAGAIRTAGEDPPPVWPHYAGEIRGQSLKPLHTAATEAVKDSPEIGEILAVLDSIRAGDTRVRKVAGNFLSKMIRDRAKGDGR